MDFNMELKNVVIDTIKREAKAEYDMENGHYNVSVWHSKDNGKYYVNASKGYRQQSDKWASFTCSIMQHSKTAVLDTGRYSAKRLQELWKEENTQFFINGCIAQMRDIDTVAMHKHSM
jgi:hypothetical protein